MIAEIIKMKQDITNHIDNEIERAESALDRVRNLTSDAVGTGVRQIQDSTSSMLESAKYEGENSIKDVAKDIYDSIFKLLKTYVMIFVIIIIVVIVISIIIYIGVIRSMNDIKLMCS